jgi:hypothetical protein
LPLDGRARQAHKVHARDTARLAVAIFSHEPRANLRDFGRVGRAATADITQIGATTRARA